uniref:Uncharacterized protein n=1 Tax=Anguilla anguilla TaxID=7936 RepID=A0A0E9PM07_ANGAN
MKNRCFQMNWGKKSLSLLHVLAVALKH